MHHRIALLFLLACTTESVAPPDVAPPTLPEQTLGTSFTAHDGGFEATVDADAVHTRIDAGIATVTTTDGALVLSPAMVGRTGSLTPLTTCDDRLAGSRVETTCGDAVAWFDHDDQGLEFGADIATRPEGEGPLLYLLDHDGAGDPWMDAERVYFSFEKVQLQIDVPTVIDANGDSIPAELTVHCTGDVAAYDELDLEAPEMDENICRVGVQVDDTDAVYPLTIDPTVRRIEDKAPKAGELTLADLAVGDLLVNEMMINPDVVPDSNGEWLEILNTTTSDIALDGLVIRDAGVDFYQYSGSAIVAAGDVVVFGRNGNTGNNGNTPVDVSYGNQISLANNPDEVYLARLDSGSNCSSGSCTTFDSVAYTNGWRHTESIRSFGGGAGTQQVFFSESATYSLDPTLADATSNNFPFAWCDGYSQYGVGQFGTPGALNDSCAIDLTVDFSWEVSAGNFVGDCIGLSTTIDGAFETTNEGDGTFTRYTYYGNANERGQVLEWTYNYATPSSTPSRFWLMRDFNIANGDFDLPEIIAFDTNFALGGTFEVPCP